jgi:hypothetical protein
MKVLVVFIDMLRANRLATFNNYLISDTVIDHSFRKLGGTFYRNCFRPGPDTPRGISAVTTGLPPYLNGCDKRLKWPRDYLNSDLKTIYDLFIEKDYKIDILSDPRERDVGIFPKHITNLDIHPEHYHLEKYLDNLVIEDNHFIFLCLPQFHWTLDALGSSENGEKNALNDIAASFDIVFNKLDKDIFDHIFIFSDHGFKFVHEVRMEPEYMLLNDDRIHTVMIHRKKFQSELIINDKLCSIADIYSACEDILGQDTKGFSLFSDKAREYIVIEDHINFIPEVNKNIEFWAIVNLKSIYIRTLSEAFLIDRQTMQIVDGIVKNFDNILEEESSYKEYKREYEKFFVYSHNLQVSTGDNYKKIYDFRRERRSRLISIFFIIKDIVVRFTMDILSPKKYK